MTKECLLPKVGDRVGFVCGPCQNPQENAGTVTRVYSTRFYANNADVQMDNGTTESIVGAYTTEGIGAYLIRRQIDLEVMAEALKQTHPGFQANINAIAAVASKPAPIVFALWKEYQAKCMDQSALLFEFVQWYAVELGGDRQSLIEATLEL